MILAKSVLIFIAGVCAVMTTVSEALSQESNETITKTACISALGYDDLDLLKSDLLLEAKRSAVNELFGELIIASTDVRNFVVTNDEIRASSVGFVREQGNISFVNGSNLAEVCVTIEAFTTEEDRKKFEPIRIEKRECASDPELSTRNVKELAKKKSIIQALIDYDRKLKDVAESDVLQLLRRVTYSNSDFISGTETYCTDVSGYVLPIEVITLLAGNDSKSKPSLHELDFVEEISNVEVYADEHSVASAPLKTTLNVSQGDQLIITVATSDTWSAGDESRLSNADGLGPNNSYGDTFDKYSINDTSHYYGSLVGRIGDGDYFFIGTNFSQNVREDGILYLANWDEDFENNTGSVNVQIVHRSPKHEEEVSENIAIFGTVTASSTYSGCYQPTNVIDGIAKGWPNNPCNEWASAGERDGAWLRIDFQKPAYVTSIVLHDRPNKADDIISGRLLFSDGTIVPISGMPNDGVAHLVQFDQKYVKWVRLIVDEGQGPNVGVSEMKIYGYFQQQ